MNHQKGTFLLGLSLILTLMDSSFGKNLDSYREQLFWNELNLSTEEEKRELSPEQKGEFQEKLQERLDERALESKERAEEIRKRLSAKAPDNKWPSLSSQGDVHRLSSSSFFKIITKKEVEKLRNIIEFGEPMSFDPGAFSYEQEQRWREHKQNQCQEAIGEENIPKLLDQLVSEFFEKDQRKVKTQKMDLALKDFYKSSELFDLADNIKDRIQVSEAGLGVERGIFETLGQKIYRLEVIDGIVRKIRITNLSSIPFGSFEKIGETSKIGLDLSMLISIRSGRDDYFIRLIECFYFHLDDKIQENQEARDKEKKKWAIRRSEKKIRKLEDQIQVDKKIRDYILEKMEGAKRVNRLLMSLSTEQIDLLIDLFLTLRGNDIPNASDFDPEKGMNLLLQKAIEGESEKNNPQTYSKETQQVFRDHQFYSQLDEELSALSDTLLFEEEALREQKVELERIKKGGK